MLLALGVGVSVAGTVGEAPGVPVALSKRLGTVGVALASTFGSVAVTSGCGSVGVRSPVPAGVVSVERRGVCVAVTVLAAVGVGVRVAVAVGLETGVFVSCGADTGASVADNVAEGLLVTIFEPLDEFAF